MANKVRRCWYHWPFRSGVSNNPQHSPTVGCDCDCEYSNLIVIASWASHFPTLVTLTITYGISYNVTGQQWVRVNVQCYPQLRQLHSDFRDVYISFLMSSQSQSDFRDIQEHDKPHFWISDFRDFIKNGSAMSWRHNGWIVIPKTVYRVFGNTNMGISTQQQICISPSILFW